MNKTSTTHHESESLSECRLSLLNTCSCQFICHHVGGQQPRYV